MLNYDKQTSGFTVAAHTFLHRPRFVCAPVMALFGHILFVMFTVLVDHGFHICTAQTGTENLVLQLGKQHNHGLHTTFAMRSNGYDRVPSRLFECSVSVISDD